MANITFPIHVNLPDDWVDQIIDRLRNDPDADWVDVTRCRECKHWKNEHLCESLSRFGSFETKADFYCGYAERRTDEPD